MVKGMGKRTKGLDLEILRPIVEQALKEDIGEKDITTSLLVPPETRVEGHIRAKEEGVIAGLPVAELVFKTVDRNLRVKIGVKEGQKVRKGRVIAEVRGRAGSILRAERTALNFLQRLSGIATLTNRFVEKVRPYRALILDTRKTTPNLRILEKYAVGCGGGRNHRMGLYDQVLIKDNHLRIVASTLSGAQGLRDVVQRARKRIREGMKIEVEAKNLSQLRQLRGAGVDIIMLDNMTVKRMKKAVQVLKSGPPVPGARLPLIEASGGITLKNVSQIAKTGVDRISIGALTHSALALDISLDVTSPKMFPARKGTKKG
jgi:nicotinate-nucleotide pyrophosphorylase (carboxylating)